MTQILAPFYSSLSTTTFTLPPSVNKRDGGMAKLVSSVCYLTNTLLADSIC